MTYVESAAMRPHRLARAKVAGGAVAGLASTIALVAACVSGSVEICDPVQWQGGAKNPSFLEACCDPALWDRDPGRGVVDNPGCPNDGTDAGPFSASDAGDASADGPIEAPCIGQCLPWAHESWGLPMFVWIGPEPEAPPCPDTALSEVYAGRTDLDARELSCGQCGCEPPDGGCTLPATLTANAAMCSKTNPSTAQTPFDPPTEWGGGCTTHDAVAAGALCDGASCVQSLVIAPPAVNESGCTATQPPIPSDPPASSFLRACKGQAGGACSGGFFCAPPPVPGFRMCVSQQGDHECMGSTYTEKHLSFTDVDDTRSCSPCTCSDPSGSNCTVTISIYPDSACASAATYGVTIDSTGPVCTDVIKGASLGSKSASAPTYAAGACQPAGGAPVGSATPANLTTFCCIPQP